MIENGCRANELLYYDSKTVRNLRRQNAVRRKSEKETMPGMQLPGSWPIEHSDLSKYMGSFNEILPQNEFRRLLEKKSQSDKPTAVADLMASDVVVTSLVEDFGFSFGMAVSLGAPRILSQDLTDRIANLNLDLTFKHAWKVIREKLSKRGFEGFDLIISRPMGGIINPQLVDALYFMMLNQAWQLLRKNGVLLFQALDLGVDDEGLRPFFRGLQTRGVGVVCGELSPAYPLHPVMLTKTPSSPPILPTPKMLGMKI